MLKRIPVIIVSGFLGSGKTTFLRYIIENANKNIALIINEFGDVGIDGDLIKSCNKCDNDLEQKIVELNNGCLCCTVQDDFIPSIKSLLKSNSQIDILIIETSGLALPIPLLKALNWPEIRSSVYLEMVIGIVNGESMVNNSPINDLNEINTQFQSTQIIEHNCSIEELFKEQLEVSDVVIISRGDLLKKEEYSFVKNKVQDQINSNIPIIKSFNGQIDLGYIFDSKVKKNNHQRFVNENHSHSHTEIFSDYLKCNYFLDKENFKLKITEILYQVNILRIKGRVWIPGKVLPLQVQIVGRKINIWFEAAPSECWRPKNGGGLEFVLIGLEKDSFVTFKRKIKEKFNILNDPKTEF